MAKTSGQYLVRQWNTWYAVVMIPKALRPFFTHKKDGPRAKKGQMMTRLSQCLETDSLEVAELRKLPIVAKFKAMISAVRQETTPDKFDFDLEVQKEQERFRAVGGDADAAVHVAKSVGNIRGASPELKDDIYGIGTGEVTLTSTHVSNWIKQTGYNQKGKDEAERFVRNNFCKRFPMFEVIERGELKIWVEDMLQGRDGYPKHSRRTVQRNVGLVTNYWEYCEDKYVKVDCLTRNILPKQSKTSEALQSQIASSWHPYSVEQYFMLLDGADQLRRGAGDQQVKDLIMLAAHTGCRLSELCNMKLKDVTDEWLRVADKAKTYSGFREIPIHPDIQQLVQRLVDESTDGYLMSGLSANNKYKNRSTALEKRFLRLLKKMNFKGNFAVHSFRAMLANQFENAGVEENFAARIIGHKVESMTYGLYSGKIDWNNAVEAMRKIKYVRPAYL